MKSEYGFLISASAVRISIDELVARDEGVGPFIWVRPSKISGIDRSSILAKNLKSRKKLEFNLGAVGEDVSPEASVCSYLESCVRHRSDREIINVDDVVDACIYMMVQWGSSIPAHGFYGDADLLSPSNASRILKLIRAVYFGLENEILRQNIRYFAGEHYRASGAWILNGATRFADVLDSEDIEFLSKINLDEIGSRLNF